MRCRKRARGWEAQSWLEATVGNCIAELTMQIANQKARPACGEANREGQKWHHKNLRGGSFIRPIYSTILPMVIFERHCRAITLKPHGSNEMVNRHTHWLHRWSVTGAAIVLLPVLACAGDQAGPNSSGAVTQLLTRDLAGSPGKEALMITVTYSAGGSSLPHRHDAEVFVYVLEGEITMQVDGSAPVTLHPGQTFYEGPGDIHRISANASQTAPAKILVFMIKDKGKPASRGIGPQGPK